MPRDPAEITNDVGRYERLLFEYYTTNRTDYRDGEIRDSAKTEPRERPSPVSKEKPPLKYVHTMQGWRQGASPPPFDLLLEPKPITRTDPRRPQEHYERQPDPEREAAQRTRPRRVLPPACSLDDVPDAATRAVLLDYTYTSNVALANRDIDLDYLCVRAPLVHPFAPAVPIKLKTTAVPKLDPWWMCDMLSWDNKQLRAYVDIDRDFWLRQPTTESSAVVQGSWKVKLCHICLPPSWGLVHIILQKTHYPTPTRPMQGVCSNRRKKYQNTGYL